MGLLNPYELIVILIIVLVVFGPKRLPGLGRSLGTGMREFRDSITGGDKDNAEHDERPAITPAAAETVVRTGERERERVPESRG